MKIEELEQMAEEAKELRKGKNLEILQKHLTHIVVAELLKAMNKGPSEAIMAVFVAVATATACRHMLLATMDNHPELVENNTELFNEAEAMGLRIAKDLNDKFRKSGY